MTDSEKPMITIGSDAPPPEEGIGDRIRERRKELDLSVEELASLTTMCSSGSEEGISAPTLYRYESKGSKPGARELRLLCEALNVSPSILLLGKEWDLEQESDAKIASILRSLVAEISHGGVRIAGKSNQGRSEWHHFKLTEVKKARHKTE